MDSGISRDLLAGRHASDSTAWLLFQLLPIMEGLALVAMQLMVFVILRTIARLPAAETRARMGDRLRRSYGYWLRVLALQWPGLVYRCMLRMRCEADDDASANGGADRAAGGTRGSFAQPLTCVYSGHILDVELLQPASVLLFVLLVLPLFVGLRIRRGISQRSPRSKELRETYGRFFGALRPQAYGWAAAAPISFACLAALSAGLPEHADVQAWLAFALLLGGAYARASLKPYIVALHGV